MYYIVVCAFHASQLFRRDFYFYLLFFEWLIWTILACVFQSATGGQINSKTLNNR